MQAINLNPDDSCQLATWNGEDYPCCAGSAKSMRNLSIGGFADDADLIIVIQMDDLIDDLENAASLTGNIPLAKQTVEFNGTKYRIDSTEIPPGLAFIVLALIDPTKGV